MAKNKFSLSNTLEAFIDVGADFLFGTKKSSSVSQADIFLINELVQIQNLTNMRKMITNRALLANR